MICFFYNYILKCFVLIDLKTERITHKDVGQMDMYDELKKFPDDNPTLGIVLCSETDEDIARYSVLHGNDQLFASKYKLYLPTEEELREEIEMQKAIFYLQQKDEEEAGGEEADHRCYLGLLFSRFCKELPNMSYFEIPDNFEINRSAIKENASFQELNTLLEEIRNFMYEIGFLTYDRDSIVLHQVGVISGNQILDSVSRTVESIRYCCLNANFADAYSLLRKYRDDAFYYIYMLAVGDKTDFMKFVELKDLGKDERNIYDWVKNQQNDVYIGAIFKAIASSSAGDAIRKYKLKDSFDRLAIKLNNFVHSNGQAYYNFSYYRMDTYSDITKYCKEFGTAITYITMSFLMVLVLIRPGLIRAEDYVDYLDCGDTPPDGSQYWVASFVSEFINKHKGILDEKFDEYLRGITGMQI